MAGVMVHTVPASCPYLGLTADTRTRFDYPHPANRCHSQRTPLRVKVGFQATFCLGLGWLQCPLYRAADRRAAPTGMHYAGHQASWVPLGRAKRSMLRTALWAAGLLLTLLAAIELLLNSFWAVG